MTLAMLIKQTISHATLLGLLLASSAAWANGADPSATDPAAGLALADSTESLLGAIAKMLGALAVVVGLMLALFYWVKKLGLGRIAGTHQTLIRVLDSRMIAPKKYVAVLQVPGERIVVGITDQQINFLTSLGTTEELEPTAAEAKEGSAAGFSSLLQTAASRLGRKGDSNREEGRP